MTQTSQPMPTALDLIVMLRDHEPSQRVKFVARVKEHGFRVSDPYFIRFEVAPFKFKGCTVASLIQKFSAFDPRTVIRFEAHVDLWFAFDEKDDHVERHVVVEQLVDSAHNLSHITEHPGAMGATGSPFLTIVLGEPEVPAAQVDGETVVVLDDVETLRV